LSISLQAAEHIAWRIASELEPYCERIMVAGSIRRQRPNVNDVDLVVLPKAGQEDQLRDRCKRNARRIQADGPQTLVFYLPSKSAGPEGLQIDLWIAQRPTGDLFQQTSTNFGTLLLCRTGSKEHNVMLCSHAHTLGLHWNPYQGLFDRSGVCLARATEEEIFAALKLDFVPPKLREVGVTTL